jgi:hypothetical protein
LKTDDNVSSNINKQNKNLKQTYFLLASRKALTKRAGSGSGCVPKCHGSTTLEIRRRDYSISTSLLPVEILDSKHDEDVKYGTNKGENKKKNLPQLNGN